jgi:hypothetical protein
MNMRKLIYVALTLVSAISITGCSKPITENELAAIQETEETDLHSIPTPQDTTQKEINDKKAADISNAPVETTIELEGNKETVRMLLNESALGYQMSYDIDRFTVTSEDGFDYYRTENSDSTKYPDIYIKIGRIDKASDTDYISQKREALLLENPDYNESTDVKLGDYNTTQFSLTTGKGWNSIIKNIYLLETDTSYYSIETQCFQEALEGYGARMEAILDTFSVN